MPDPTPPGRESTPPTDANPSPPAASPSVPEGLPQATPELDPGSGAGVDPAPAQGAGPSGGARPDTPPPPDLPPDSPPDPTPEPLPDGPVGGSSASAPSDDDESWLRVDGLLVGGESALPEDPAMRSLAEPEVDGEDDWALAEAAAWLALGAIPAAEPPPALVMRLRTAAEDYARHRAAALPVSETSATPAASDSPSVPTSASVADNLETETARPMAAGGVGRIAEPRRKAVLAFIGGAVAGAVAAALILALLISRPETTRPVPSGGASLAASPDAGFAAFRDAADDAQTYAWAPDQAQPDYRGVGGWVVWSPRQQGGYLVFEDLPAQDPDQRQYQLWIVDPTRDALPVDGGVFDVQPHRADDGRVYVPIDAKLPVSDPTTFAVTLEQPGGVVKSAGPLLVVAPAS